ncbi:MAG: SET domain-containing protein-lysine N-methyltransferase [Ferruginibacter sp.]
MTKITHLKETGKLISQHGIADIWHDAVTNHYSLHAASDFETGNIITPFKGASVQNYATYLTVQTGTDSHIILDPTFLQYINHSCNPNVFFDTTSMQLISIRPIKTDDEFCFFYPSTEWEMARPFVCNCGSKNCLQLINGAAHLSKETLEKYRLTDFILQKIKQKT